jgi:phosphoserine phosphatase RsbU/P
VHEAEQISECEPSPGKFVTFLYAVLDADRRTLIYENASHCPGTGSEATALLSYCVAVGPSLGCCLIGFIRITVQLERGDKLLLSTDGVTEAENTRLEEFGEQRLLEAVRACNGSALDTQRAVMRQVTAYCGGNFRDDATLLVLRVS